MGQDQSQPGGGDRKLSSSEKEEVKRLEQLEGLQIVRLLPNSVAHRAGLVPYFDIIVGIDGQRFVDIISNADVIDRLEKQGGSGSLEFRFFRDFLATHRGQTVRFDVFNLRVRHTRQVVLHLAEHVSSGGLLGCSIEWSRAVDAIARSWHIVDIIPKSPAAQCPDINPGTDHVLGMQQPQEQVITLLHDGRDFYQRLELWQSLQRTAIYQAQREVRQQQTAAAAGETGEMGKLAPRQNIPHSLLLLIYNAQENAVKEVLVEMGTQPGTPLGLVLATGAIHWIPSLHTADTSALPVMNHFCVTNSSSFETTYSESAATNAATNVNAAVPGAPADAEAPHAPAVANPFRSNSGDLPAYPPPSSLPPGATSVQSSADAVHHSASGYTPYTYGEANSEPRQPSPPSLVATAEPSFDTAHTLSGSFPRTGGEVHLPSWASPNKPPGSTDTGALAPPAPYDTSSSPSQQTMAAPPPPPAEPPQPAEPPTTARTSHADPPPHSSAPPAPGPQLSTNATPPHHYPDPSLLGVHVADPVASSSDKVATEPAMSRAPAATPASGEPAAAPVEAPAVQRAVPHPPLPPHIAEGGVFRSSHANVLSPPRPPAHIAEVSLRVVPRPPLNFDLFGDAPARS